MGQQNRLRCNVNKTVEMIVRVDYLTTLSRTIYVDYLLIINLKRCKKKYPWRCLAYCNDTFLEGLRKNMQCLSRNIVCIIHTLKTVSWLNILTNLKSCEADPGGCAI
jgi:hypothetical protein